VGDDSGLVIRQKILGEDGSVRRDVVMVKQPGLFSPKFGTTSPHVFMQLPQNLAVRPGIHILACLDRCFALPQLLYRWRNQSGIFWTPPRIILPTECTSTIMASRLSCTGRGNPRFLYQSYEQHKYISSHGTAAQNQPRPPHCQDFTITLRHTILGRTPLDE
jgi:hypothetical protein